MAKIYHSKSGNTQAVCSFPVKVNKVKTKEVEVSEEEKTKLLSGQFKANFKKSGIEFTEIVKPVSEAQKKKQELKAKLEDGSISDEEMKEALKLLL